MIPLRTAATLGVLLLAAGPSAFTQISYGLVPAMVTEEFVPGRPFTKVLQVTNGTNSPIVMRGVALDFWYDKSNQKVFGPAGTLPRSATDWIEFVPKVVTIAPKSNADVMLVITPPESAAGGYYSVAFLETRPELAEPARDGKRALYTNVRLGALILLTARGTAKPALDVGAPEVSPPGSTEKLSVSLTTQNTGNVHLFPTLSMLILDAGGTVRARAEAEPMRMLPGQVQRLSVSSAEALPPGNYEAVVNLLYGDDQVHSRSARFEVKPSPEASGHLTSGSREAAH